MSTQGSQTSSQLPPPQSYTIGGIKVMFPTKAYPSQIAMMNKVIQGLKQRNNCLLESPTGSGKSLALLCASLAWQRHEAARVNDYNAAIDERQAADERKRLASKGLQKRGTQEAVKNGVTNGNLKIELEETGKDVWVKPNTSSSQFVIELTDDEDDFQPSKRVKQSFSPPQDRNEEEFHVKPEPPSYVKPEPPSYVKPEPPSFEKNISTPMSVDSDRPFCPLADKKLRSPKIFFGTRTHKQIAQITRELRKTEYKIARSIILASREYTCVHPVISKQPNKNEACKELLNEGGCPYQQSAKKFGTFPNIQNIVRPGYDLEEFVQAGRENSACPYYATRNLMINADIIFCPYNYLVEPHIRKSLSLELEGNIVILDEAHNMEDSSREAASSSINQDDIQMGIQDCEKVGRCWSGSQSVGHRELAEFLSELSLWIDSQLNQMTELDFSNEGKHWIGTEFFAIMKNVGVADRLDACKMHFKDISEQRELQLDLVKERGRSMPSAVRKDKPVITAATVLVIEEVFRVFDQLQREAGKYRDDFRVALLKSTIRRRRDTHGPTMNKIALSLNFWCLNPAVAFGDLKDQVHCVILTSGTLSPIQSFQSELGTPFPIKLEASHVIDQNQIYAGIVACGPSNKNLNGSYQRVETFEYQDELGDMITRVCRIIPHGVLCFFPSYRLLQKVTERWQMTSCWNTLENIKDVYIEPRTGNADFQDIISSFYNSIEETNEGSRGSITGALFMAVCRGKVSEGLDFADNNARAVICIGIPFPNWKDLQVGLKRDYNEKNRSRGLLSGSEWYEIQAFRALNQALGRCIRHRHDWGAILLVDERFQKSPRYVNSLSKWVRSSVRPFNSWLDTEDGLVEFRDQMLVAMPRPMQTSKEIDIDLPGDNGAGTLLGNHESSSRSSSKNGLVPGYSDRFSNPWGIPSPSSNGQLGLNNSLNSKSPYFGSRGTPKAVFSIFAKPTTSKAVKNKVPVQSTITFDDD